MDIPWGITLSAKLTLATPTPFNDIACYGATFPTGSGCTPIAATPGGNGKFLLGGKVFGYRDIDFQATKNFDLGYGMKLYGRFDLLNAFNFKNYTDVLTNWGSNGVLNSNPVMYNPTGNITFVPRTIKFTIGMKF